MHSKEFHSLDVFWFELIGVICWFNPIVYFMQKEIKLVHEYVADQKAALFLGSKKSYAQILLGSHFRANGNILVNNFYNKSILKTRIMMLSKEKSKKTAIVKYGLIAPLFLGMFVFTAACTESSLNSTSIEELAPQGLLKEESINSGNIIGEIEGDVLTNVEIAPQFPNGGVKKMYEFINKNIKYPKAAQSANISGRVFVKFVVDKEGKVRDPSILKGIGFGADKETIRIVKMMPKWNPGKQDGQPVNVYFTMPIFFQLE
ncbi:MAG: TonB family protein [Arcticibacterium sp.]